MQCISVTLGAGSTLPLRQLKAERINCAHGEAAAPASPVGKQTGGRFGAARTRRASGQVWKDEVWKDYGAVGSAWIVPSVSSLRTSVMVASENGRM